MVPPGPSASTVRFWGTVSSGGVASTVKVTVAGEGSTFPTASVARTANVWAPSASPVRPRGEVQAVKPPPSTLHAKLAGAPVAVNAIESVVVLIVAGTEVVMLVDGGVVSTVKARVAAALVPPTRRWR